MMHRSRAALAWPGLTLALIASLVTGVPAAQAQPGATPPAPEGTTAPGDADASDDTAASPGQTAPGATAPGATAPGATAPGATASGATAPAPAPPPSDGNDGDASAEVAPAGERELGARLGVAMGRRFTPGGVRVAGVMLYRLSQTDWFDGSMAFTFGRSRSTCFTDRDGAFACDYGVIDGTAIDLVAGIRHFLPGPEGFAPYVRAGVGVRLLSFGGDDVRGLAIPASAGVGVRARVSDLVAVGGDVGAEAGIAWLDHGLGSQSQLGIVLHALVELWLD
ncbi:MAG TPA: hypothetical protein VNM90_14040 [Haliangium sp.]|nr:hypothetical protein [Haliangium sp.]